MKRIYEMSEEEILDEALGAIPEYLSRLGRTGRFSTEECLMISLQERIPMSHFQPKSER